MSTCDWAGRMHWPEPSKLAGEEEGRRPCSRPLVSGSRCSEFCTLFRVEKCLFGHLNWRGEMQWKVGYERENGRDAINWEMRE